MSKKKHKKKKKTDLPKNTIPESASTVRFLIFLAIGLVLLVVFLVVVVRRGLFY